MGPSLDLVLRRSKLASDNLYKQACKKPATTKVEMGEGRGELSVLFFYIRTPLYKRHFLMN